MGDTMKKWLLALSALSFSSLAFADKAAAAQGPGMHTTILMSVGFLFIFYFMLIRPQTKRAKEHQALISSIAKDDEVILSGGLLGKVTKITEQFLVVSLADGMDVKVQRHAVTATVPKGTMKSI